ELVRHRAGAAYSQESMRFVRLDDIPMYIPELSVEFNELAQINFEGKTGIDPKTYGSTFQETYRQQMMAMAKKAEEYILEWATFLDHPKVPFHLKKVITSALRRFVPGGHTTNIIVTANHRAWRHMIEQRTAPGAEEEIVKVFGMIAGLLGEMYPAFYQDMDISLEDGSI